MFFMDRKEFAKRLNSLVTPEGTSPEEMKARTFPLYEALSQMMPDSLFRFRAFNEDSLGAFRDGIIYAVTADRFNDPYDTLARYDIEEIEKGVNTIMSLEALEGLKSWFGQGNDIPEDIKRFMPSGMPEALKSTLLALDDIKSLEDRILERKFEFVSYIRTYFPVLTEMSKRFSTVACFCEDVQPILMWSHYADSHKGFALEYNFRPTLLHPLKNIGIFPVIYDDERVDISSYIAWTFLFFFGTRILNPDISAPIKNALYKSSVWEYEREWRLIDFSLRDFSDDRPSAIHYEPVAIYYGQKMPHENKSRLHQIAQEKGLKEFEMYLDYSSPSYEMKYREAVASNY